MKVLSILLLSILLLPVSAQEESPVSAQEESPVSAREESIVGTDKGLGEYGSILITISASVIGSFIGGTLLGHFISNRSETNRHKQELKNIQSLIKSDFTTFRRMLIDDLKDRKKTFEYFMHGKELTENEKKSDAFHTMNFLSTQRYFLFWKSIENSGILLKLQPLDLKTIRIVMDALQDADMKLQESFKEFLNLFKQKKDTPDGSVYAFLNYSERRFQITILMLNIISMMKEIDWFDFESEIKPLKNNKKGKKDFVVPDEKKLDFEVSDEITQDWADLKKSYRSGKLMTGFIKEMEFIEKEISKTEKPH